MHSILAARTTFSIGESILTVDELIKQATASGATAVGLTDTMTVTGMIDLSNKAKSANIKPIIGCRLRLVDDPTSRKVKGEKWRQPEYFVTWYVLSERGLKALFKLLTLANSEERFYFNAKLGFDDLYKALEELTFKDVVIATGDVRSVLAHPNANDILAKISRAMRSNNLFVTLTPINSPYYDTMNKKAIEQIVKHNYPPLVTRPALYEPGASGARDVMYAVSENIRLTDLWVQSPVFDNLHPMPLKTFVGEAVSAAKRLERRGITDASKHFREGLQFAKILVDQVEYIWSKAPVSLPVMASDEFLALVELTKKGWSERLFKQVFGHRPTPRELDELYRPRLAYELSVLKKLGFAGYFLLVKDIVGYAKANGIMVGPGRGSVGGSLVAYLTGITDCDPIRFGLLFERFINPDRIDLPDADLDFMSSRRGEIIDYLITKYGKDRVAGISNFSTLAAASTLRGVGKAFNLSEVDYSCSKLAPKAHGANIPLPQAAEMVSEIAKFRDANPDIWSYCTRLEGSMTNYGRHAAGVVVGGCDLVERGVVERRKDGATMNWDKRIVEDQGLIKVDILGLEALDIIKLALDYIRKRHGKHVDLLRIPLDNPKVLERFGQGDTTGIFQFESAGMRRLLRELGADGVITFDDITAATALYRPGPMESGMMDSYWKRKQGIEAVTYDHPLMEAILASTFGVIVYQEQVMQISQAIAGYSAPDADKLRKIMGKKLPEEMRKERGKFIQGCIATIGCTEDWAGELFDKIEGFAGYGFNKSHATTYTLISYQAMYLKTYFPIEFYAASLSLMGEDKLPAILSDALKAGIEVDTPDINLSTEQFEILTDTRIIIPFNRVKGIGDGTAQAIVAARASGPFASKDDLLERVERRRCNTAHVAKLDLIGAFARIEPGQLGANDPSRIKDQRELIPGLIMTAVPIGRKLQRSKEVKEALADLVTRYRTEHEARGVCVKPLMGGRAAFVAIYDAPNAGEESGGQMTQTQAFGSTAAALAENGLEKADGYFTALIKRPKGGKQVSSQEIDLYGPILKEELDLLKPPVIVLLGSIAARTFLPDLKGKASEHAGKVFYNKDLDANIVVGFNPGEIYHDPDKQELMNEVFRVVAELIG